MSFLKKRDLALYTKLIRGEFLIFIYEKSGKNYVLRTFSSFKFSMYADEHFVLIKLSRRYIYGYCIDEIIVKLYIHTKTFN